MKKIPKDIEPIIKITPALCLYVKKQWKNKFEAQLDKLENKFLSEYTFNNQYAEFRYNGYVYQFFDDRIRFRSLKETNEKEILEKDFKNIKYY